MKINASKRLLNLMIAIGVAIVITSCHREAPLPADLSAIKCGYQPENNQFARVKFGAAEVTYVCISKALAETPKLLKCDLESRPMVCEERGFFSFSRTATGQVYVGVLQVLENTGILPKKPADDVDVPYESELGLSFTDQPFKEGAFNDFAEEETGYQFLFPEAKDYLPRQFQLLKGPLCYKKATVLNNGYCYFNAKTKSLYWRIMIVIRRKEGTEIRPTDYRHEFVFWEKYLAQIVKDPV